jgi:hypothetical protein
MYFTAYELLYLNSQTHNNVVSQNLDNSRAQDHKTEFGDQTRSQASDWLLKWRPGHHFSQSDA